MWSSAVQCFVGYYHINYGYLLSVGGIKLIHMQALLFPTVHLYCFVARGFQCIILL